MKIKLGDVCNFEKGLIGIQKAIPGKYPLVVTGPERKSCNSYQFDCEAVCIPLVSSTGHGHKSLNYIHYQSGKFALGTILVALVPKNKNILNTEYLREYLYTQKDRLLVPLMKGGANVTLPIKSISDLEIELPSLEKQKQIVEITRSLRKQLNDINKNIEINESQLIKLRSSILVKAIQGKLVSQDRNDEPAEKILEKIKTEKEKFIEEGRLRKEKFLSPISPNEIPFEIPKGWIWCRLNDLINFFNGYSFSSPLFKNEGVGIVRIGDIQNGEIREDTMVFLNKELAQKIDKSFYIFPGDLVIAMSGATTGKLGFNMSKKTYLMNQRVGKIDCLLANKNYIFYFLSTEIEHNLSISKGSAIPNLATQQIKNIIISLPPLNEQKRIVEKVKLLMGICDDQEKNITEAKEDINKLPQAILSKAFQGEL